VKTIEIKKEGNGGKEEKRWTVLVSSEIKLAHSLPLQADVLFIILRKLASFCGMLGT